MNKYIRNIKMYLLTSIEPDKKTMSIYLGLKRIFDRLEIVDNDVSNIYTYKNVNTHKKELAFFTYSNHIEFVNNKDLLSLFDRTEYEVSKETILWYFNNIFQTELKVELLYFVTDI